MANAIAAEARPNLVLTTTFSGRAGMATPSSGSSSDRYGPLPNVPELGRGSGAAAAHLRSGVAGATAGSCSQRGGCPGESRSGHSAGNGRIQDAYVSLQVSQAGLLSLSRALEASLANYAQAEARFKAGLATAVELADAEALRTDAEIQLAVGQFDASRAQARLTRLMSDAS